MFPTEYAVAGKEYNGRGFSLFAPVETVEDAGDGKGRMRVEKIDQRDNLVLVRLPAYIFGGGQYVTVTSDVLQEIAREAAA
jgi:hypothetical protein